MIMLYLFNLRKQQHGKVRLVLSNFSLDQRRDRNKLWRSSHTHHLMKFSTENCGKIKKIKAELNKPQNVVDCIKH